MEGVKSYGLCYIYYISHQLSNFWMNSSSLMVPLALEYQHGPLVVPYMSSISHNNAVMNTFNDEPIFEDSFLNDDEGGVGGLNHTPSLVKPLVIVTMFLVPKSYVTFVVNVNSNLGIQFWNHYNQGFLYLL